MTATALASVSAEAGAGAGAARGATPASGTSASASARSARTELPSAPRRIRVGMPQLDVGGLSEGWLFRYAGDLHWEAIARQFDAATHELCGGDGDRLYPTVVAARARYQSPLASVRENDVLAATVEVAACGRSCAHGGVRLDVLSGGASRGSRLSVELLTTFASRDDSGALRMALPAARLAARWIPSAGTPTIARLAKAARRGQPLLGDRFSGPSLAPEQPVVGRMTYEPSPYADYNGAGLLYFASYVTIADTTERRMVRDLGLAPFLTGDWALTTSVVRRDVFYYGNLPLGDSLVAELLAVEWETDGAPGASPAGATLPMSVKTRLRLRRAQTGQPIADVVTRRIIGGDAWGKR